MHEAAIHILRKRRHLPGLCLQAILHEIPKAATAELLRPACTQLRLRPIQAPHSVRCQIAAAVLQGVRQPVKPLALPLLCEIGQRRLRQHAPVAAPTTHRLKEHAVP